MFLFPRLKHCFRMAGCSVGLSPPHPSLTPCHVHVGNTARFSLQQRNKYCQL